MRGLVPLVALALLAAGFLAARRAPSGQADSPPGTAPDEPRDAAAALAVLEALLAGEDAAGGELSPDLPAAWSAWVGGRVAAHAELEEGLGFRRLEWTRRLDERPLAGTAELLGALGELGAAGGPELLRRALELAGERAGAGGSRPGPHCLHALETRATTAAKLVRERMLGGVGELQPAARSLAAWIARTGGTWSPRSDEAPAYELGFSLRGLALPHPAGPDGPGAAELPTATSAYHLFRALGGEPARSRGWSAAERALAGGHRSFDGRSVDLGAGAQALLGLAPVLEPAFLARLAAELAELAPGEGAPAPRGIEGELLLVRETPFGTLVVGGPGPNRYVDPEAAVLVDVGGDDEHVATRPGPAFSLVIDLAGDDLYRCEGVGGPGAGVCSFSVLVDRSGDDVYVQGVDPEGLRARCAADVGVGDERRVDPGRLYSGAGTLDRGFAFGAALHGIGVLIDHAGDDVYAADKWSLGAALGPGLGLLVDEQGADVYVAGALSQGAGVAAGVGLLVDRGEGDDLHQCWGVYRFARLPPQGDAGFLSFGLGAGSAWRVATRAPGWEDLPGSAGGIGCLWNERGNERYVGGNASQGSGYGGGAGFLVDLAGDDVHHAPRGDGTGRAGPARLAGAHAMGDGSHLGHGVLFDAAGDDRYGGALQSGGYGWDAGAGLLLDLAGDDTYAGSGGGRFDAGSAGAQALGVLVDLSGPDRFDATCTRLADASDLQPGFPSPASFALVLLAGGTRTLPGRGVLVPGTLRAVPPARADGRSGYGVLVLPAERGGEGSEAEGGD